MADSVGTIVLVLAWVFVLVMAISLVLLGIIAWRRRTLLKTPGTFPAKALTAVGGEKLATARGVVVSYHESSVEVLAVWSISPLPYFSVARHVLELHRDTSDHRTGSDVGLELLDLDSGARITLALSADHCAELTTWHESGPAVGIGHWREAPERVQRRRYF
ncbi:DUF2550 family protein [Auritidibacter sp. NML100628]|uniref:DUF2550 family protein n=1 Tax=Auritidibacter sp. NML100628 TaxID=2170742 RepID=UPI000D737893|nr:DUF2550 family protein [Auritidibacter sp. NML100628]PXA77518.1 hypothetical protein DCC24_04220 [Auritidibacter sp. NML100628]